MCWVFFSTPKASGKNQALKFTPFSRRPFKNNGVFAVFRDRNTFRANIFPFANTPSHNQFFVRMPHAMGCHPQIPESESLLHVVAAEALMKGGCVDARIVLDGI